MLNKMMVGESLFSLPETYNKENTSRVRTYFSIFIFGTKIYCCFYKILFIKGGRAGKFGRH